MLSTVCQAPNCDEQLTGKQRNYCCNACKQRTQRSKEKPATDSDAVPVTVIRSTGANIVIVGEKIVPVTAEIAMLIGIKIVSNPND